MSQGANEAVQVPAIVMMVVGGVYTLYFAVSALFGGIGLVLGCLGSGLGAFAVLADGSVMMFIQMIWSLVLGSISFLVTLALLAMSAYVVTGGLSMKSLSGLDKARRSSKLLVAIPVVNLVTALLVALVGQIPSLIDNPVGAIAGTCIGVTVGAIFPLIVTAVGGGAFWFTNQTLSDDTIASAFAD